MSTFNELIDFTRSTTGTYLDSVVYGDELVTNGTFDTDFTGWTDVSTGTGSIAVVSGQAQLTRVNLNNRGLISQGITVVAGATYKVQITEVSGQAYVGVGTTDIGTTFLGQPLAAGENTFYITPNVTSVYINVRGIVDGVQLIDNISVKELIGGQVSGTPLLRTAAINEPRLEYDASGNPLGLLIEEARTNLFRYSQALSNVDHNLITTDNATVSPDGTQNASLCIPTSANVEHFIDDQNVISGTDYAISCFAKYGSGSYLLSFRGASIGGNAPQFNLQTGTVVNEGASSVWSNTKIEEVGNGWYKCSSVGNPNGTSPLRFQLMRSNGAATFIGDGTGHYIWGAQVETGAFLTSYIPTSGSAVTRNRDLVSVPVERFGYNTAQCSVAVNFNVSNWIGLPNDANFYRVFEFVGNTGSSADGIFRNPVANNVRYRFNEDDGTTPAIGAANLNVVLANGNKVAVGLKGGSNYIVMDGGTDGQGTGTAATNLYSSLILSGVANLLNGHMKSLQYYPKRLSNEELEALTV